MENTAYMENITAARSLLLDSEEALAGNITLSLETCEDLQEDDVYTYIQENFPYFLRRIRNLKPEDQELLLSYYLLSKPQTILARLHKTTQTVCSFRLRTAIKTVGTFLLMGDEPTVEKMHEIFVRAGIEDTLSAPLSELVALYAKLRDFVAVARHYKLHRPDVRRSMSRASKRLAESELPEDLALSAYIFSMIDKANPRGKGLSALKASQQGHVFTVDSPIVGEFRVHIEDPDFDQLFVPRASR